jgi:hypothetical protein
MTDLTPVAHDGTTGTKSSSVSKEQQGLGGRAVQHPDCQICDFDRGASPKRKTLAFVISVDL